ncbi:hypothetical protein FOCC_FOCC013930 [Frankliniella occidentalis]|nr:hypothetical protein FOCC_FOCC013930 [Frankliniella occidentalis]
MVDHGYSHVSQRGPIPSTSTSTSNNESFEDQCITNESSNVKTSQVSMLDHGYCSQVPQEGLILSTSNDNESFEDQCMTEESSDVEMVLSTSVPSTLENVVDVEASSEDLLLQVKKKLELFTSKRWLVVVENEKLNCVYYSVQQCLTSQRCLTVNTAGDVKLFVHNVAVSIEPFTKDLQPPEPLYAESVNSYVDKIASIMNNVQKMEICSGYDDAKFQDAWSSCSVGIVDHNPFLECRYVETIRSHNCSLLVPSNKWRCSECLKLYKPLKRLTNAINLEERPIFTANKFLTEKQKLTKLAKKQIDLKNTKKKLVRLRERMQEVIKKEAVVLNPAVAEDLSEILKNCTITPAQSVFLQQQIKASQVKKTCGMRWHPTMIRFALSVHLTSPAAYELLRQTGMVKLPSSSTLFEYSHVENVVEGIDRTVLESISKRLANFPEKHKKFHVLMGDEMYISQNLVFQKSTGKMIGYTSLNHIDKEVADLEKCIDNPDREMEEIIAEKVMVYMIKGISNGIKEVVATFTTGTLTANQLYVWTWQVIGALERSGIAVVAYVSDGSSVNRSFIKKHIPASIHESGIIFSTVNLAARDRNLYFIADVPHLLKTIRNCFLNSRWDGKKSRRKMMKNGLKISWDFIIKLYDLKKGKSLRKSYKLNPMNVAPDSYARMKLKVAAQVLSNTVCQDMRSQKWPDAAETENFIEKVNEWFDCLNGAHSSQGKKTNNPNLAPYTSENDVRFETLDRFLEYLNEWEEEAKNSNQSFNSTVVGNNTVANCNESEIEDGNFNPEEETPASKRIMSKQTIDGIRMTVLAFKPLVVFLLREGVSFINARVFCQDPLEQHFSKIRAGQGGSNNPNVGQFLNRNRTLHTIGQLGMRKRKGNSGEDGSTVEVTTETLPKKRWQRTPKLLRKNDE